MLAVDGDKQQPPTPEVLAFAEDLAGLLADLLANGALQPSAEDKSNGR